MSENPEPGKKTEAAPNDDATAELAPPPRRRGRPPGAKNKTVYRTDKPAKYTGADLPGGQAAMKSKRVEEPITLGAVLRELSRVYIEARRRKLETGEAVKLTQILQICRTTIETVDSDTRLAAIEQRLGIK